jgi:hypothetical protein
MSWGQRIILGIITAYLIVSAICTLIVLIFALSIVG